MLCVRHENNIFLFTSSFFFILPYSMWIYTSIYVYIRIYVCIP